MEPMVSDEQIPTQWSQPPSASDEPPSPQTVPGAATVPVANPLFFTPANRVCAHCGGTIDFDDYCEQCGAKAPSQRDHYEMELGQGFAGVCDRGRRHARNEDALVLWADEEDLQIAVACDGVSSAPNSDIASLAAAQAITSYLVAERDRMNDADLAGLMYEAMSAGNAAVLATTPPDAVNPPSCTAAVGIICGDVVIAANIGDSRVYWLSEDQQARTGLILTQDHSMAQEEIAAGTPREVAESGPNSHVITRWLGKDAPDLHPNLNRIALDKAGWLVTCSDGLWNYFSEPNEFAGAFFDSVEQDDATALRVARHWVQAANEKGGHDNITIAICHAEPADDQVLDVPTTRTRPAEPVAENAAAAPAAD